MIVLFLFGSMFLVVSVAKEVKISPTYQCLSPNNEFHVNMTVDTTEYIRGLQFKLLFNSSVLEALSVEKGPFFSDALEPPGNTINNTVGEIVWAYGLTTPKNGTGNAVKITFGAKSLGASMLDIQGTSQVPYILIDANGNPMTEGVAINDGNISIENCFNPCDLNNDGIIIHDYNDLMTAYKCFLGIRNCANYHQNWNLIKQEYECFVNKFK